MRSRARLFAQPPIVADIDAGKREAALEGRRGRGVRSGRPRGARKRLIKATGGGVFAACDFVGSEQSLAFATGALAKGGKVVVTGLLGGNFTMVAKNLSGSPMPAKARTCCPLREETTAPSGTRRA